MNFNIRLEGGGMRWGVLWDFRKDGTERWLDDFVPGTKNTFFKISTGYEELSWHSRSSARSKLSRWLKNGLPQLQRSQLDGVITVFPPLAAIVGISNRLRWKRRRHVAWAFNLGHHPRGMKRKLLAFALAKTDRVVVHSRAEVAIVRDLLGLANGQVEFVPLQGPARPKLEVEDLEDPFVVAIGSANRDYATLLLALEATGYPAKIVASARNLDGLVAPRGVELIAGATWEDCLRLAQRARICVTPLRDPNVATGQVTIIDHLTMGRPVVATRSIGTVDYLVQGSTGMLVPAGDVDALIAALKALWNDPELRMRMSSEGQRFAGSVLSDTAVGERLGRLLETVELEPRR